MFCQFQLMKKQMPPGGMRDMINRVGALFAIFSIPIMHMFSAGLNLYVVSNIISYIVQSQAINNDKCRKILTLKPHAFLKTHQAAMGDLNKHQKKSPEEKKKSVGVAVLKRRKNRRRIAEAEAEAQEMEEETARLAAMEEAHLIVEQNATAKNDAFYEDDSAAKLELEGEEVPAGRAAAPRKRLRRVKVEDNGARLQPAVRVMQAAKKAHEV